MQIYFKKYIKGDFPKNLIRCINIFVFHILLYLLNYTFYRKSNQFFCMMYRPNFSRHTPEIIGLVIGRVCNSLIEIPQFT